LKKILSDFSWICRILEKFDWNFYLKVLMKIPQNLINFPKLSLEPKALPIKLQMNKLQSESPSKNRLQIERFLFM
jgi:hypothetical protein